MSDNKIELATPEQAAFYSRVGRDPEVHPVTSQPDGPRTVHAHVERTVHALCDAIERRITEPQLPDTADKSYVIKNLAEAVQALASWDRSDKEPAT